ncbi:MAG: ribonuclease HII [Firmicutes bacterium]|nr:ribonuclease HII [Bacillota bacterium]
MSARLARRVIAGVDEAGRGPLAGPVVAAAVILGSQVPDGLADSKQLSPSRRERAFCAIVETAAAIAVRAVSPRRIDAVNVLQASLSAMREAVLALPVFPDEVWIDGPWRVPGLPGLQRAVVGGDRTCPAIAAASIVAKVIRDRMMRMWDRVYPGYGFGQHKGYPTRAHVDALQRMGPCPIHRRTFSPVVACQTRRIS